MKSLRSALGLLALAWIVALLLHVLQTLLLQIISYESGAYAVVVKLLTIAFPLSDIFLAGAFVELARKGPSLRPLAIAAAAFLTVNVVTGLAGLSAAEPAFALGVTVAMLLVATSIATTRRVKVLAGATVLALLAWPVVRALPSRGEDAVAIAWVRWSVDAFRLAVVAGLAVLTRPDVVEVASTEQGPYRAPGEGAPPPAPSFSNDVLARVAAGLRVYRAGLIARIAATMLTTILFLGLSFAREREWPILLLLGPLASCGATVVMLVGLVRGRTGGLVVAAALTLGAGALLDAFVFLYGIATIVDRSAYSAYRRVEEAAVVSWFPVAIAGAVATILVAIALARVGRTLAAHSVVITARWVQALVCCACTFGAALAFGFAFVETRRSSTAAADLAFLGLLTFGSVVAYAVVHVVLVQVAIRAVAPR